MFSTAATALKRTAAAAAVCLAAAAFAAVPGIALADGAPADGSCAAPPVVQTASEPAEQAACLGSAASSADTARSETPAETSAGAAADGASASASPVAEVSSVASSPGSPSACEAPAEDPSPESPAVPAAVLDVSVECPDAGLAQALASLVPGDDATACASAAGLPATVTLADGTEVPVVWTVVANGGSAVVLSASCASGACGSGEVAYAAGLAAIAAQAVLNEAAATADAASLASSKFRSFDGEERLLAALPAQFFASIGNLSDMSQLSIADNGATHWYLMDGYGDGEHPYVANACTDRRERLANDAGFTVTVSGAAADIYGNAIDAVVKVSGISSGTAAAGGTGDGAYDYGGFCAMRFGKLSGKDEGALLAPQSYFRNDYTEESCAYARMSMDISVRFVYAGTSTPVVLDGTFNLRFTDIDISDGSVTPEDRSAGSAYSEALSVRSGIEWLGVPSLDYSAGCTKYCCWVLDDGTTFKAGNWQTEEQLVAAGNTMYSGFAGVFNSSSLNFHWTGSACGTNILMLANTWSGIRINKVSADPSVTDGNSEYSLAGAVFGIYSDPSCTQLVRMVRTNEQGIAASGDALDLAPAVYYVKEVSASTGYKRNTSVWTVDAREAGTVCTVIVAEEPWVTTISLLKSSSAPEISEASASYSLAGAVYGIYGSFADAALDENRLWTLTTDASGASNTVSGPYGTEAGRTYYIRELAACPGFLKDGSIATFTVKLGADAVYETTDAPLSDPPVIYKVDSVLGRGEGAQGDGTLGDALYAWTWYDGLFETEEAAKAAGANSRSWVFKTDADGFLMCCEEQFVSGDALFHNSLGVVSCPLGSVFVKEKAASEGYSANEATAVAWIVKSDEFEWATAYWKTVPKNGDSLESVLRGGVRVCKYDAETGQAAAQGDADLGAVFTVYNLSENDVVVDGVRYGYGQAVGTLKADAETGVAVSAADWLPYGTYGIRETAAPRGYLGNAELLAVFRVREQGAIVDKDITSTGLRFGNEVVRGGVELAKWDAGLVERYAQGDGALDAVLEVVNASAHGVLVDGVLHAPGEVVAQITLSQAGLWRSANDWLPYGSYTVREKAASTGYVLDASAESPFAIRSDGAVVSLDTAAGAIGNEVARGGVRVCKYDAETGQGRPQGDGVLDATFAVYNLSEHDVVVDGVRRAPGELVGTMVADGETGVAVSAADWLPYGTYGVLESAAPATYLPGDGGAYVFTVRRAGAIADTDGLGRSLAFGNAVRRGGILVGKRDLELDAARTQGDAADFSGATFRLVNASAHSVVVDGVEYAPGETITEAIVLDASGTWGSAADWLPYGTYTLTETAAPTGYVLDGILTRTFSIRETGVVTDLTGDLSAIKDRVARGGVEISKWDAELGERTAQGDGDLAATVDVVNRSLNPVLVDGTLFAAGAVVKTVTLSAEGLWKSAADWLPYGTYEVVERVASAGYRLLGVLSRTFSIREDGTAVSMDNDALALKDYVQRAGLEAAKWDLELNERRAQGDGNLAARFEVVNASSSDVLVDGVRYAPGAVVFAGALSDAGLWASAADWLPYGTYIVRETVAPQGYLLEGVLERTVVLHESAVVESMDRDSLALKDKVQRAGIEVAKWDFELNERRAQGDGSLAAGFEIVNASACGVQVGGVLYAPGAVVFAGTLSDAGLWASAADWLPYGTYTVREMRAPEGYLLEGATERTVVLHENGAVESMDNDALALKDRAVRGGILVALWDSELDERYAQGDGSLAARFEIVNESAADVLVDGVRYAPGAVIFAGNLSSDGLWESAADWLPYGTYKVRETEPAEGYLMRGVLSRTVSVRDAGAVVSMDNAENALKNPPKRGGLEVAKWDADLNERLAQGDGDLAAWFEVVNASAHDVLVDGVRYAPGAAVFEGTLSEAGLWASDGRWLPYGTYTVRETKAPVGYLVEGETSRTVSIREDGLTVSMDNDALALKDYAARGKIAVEKHLIGNDGTEVDPYPARGIEVEVINSSAREVAVGAYRYAPGDVVITLVLDAEGRADTPLLPFGTYTLREVPGSVPEGVQPWSWTQTGAFGSDAFALIALHPEDALEAGGVWKAPFTDYVEYDARVLKLDADTYKGVAGCEFTLWYYVPVEIENGSVTTDWRALSADDPGWHIMRTAWSGADGAVDLGTLPFGVYRIDETYAAPAYMSAAESAGLAGGADTSRIFALDRTRVFDPQIWYDRKVELAARVAKSTVAKTSAGLVYVDADGRTVSNPDSPDEAIRYDVSFSCEGSNVWSDEFWVEDACEMTGSPWDLRIVSVVLPEVAAGTDADGVVWVLAKTNLTRGGDAAGTDFSQPQLVPGSVSDLPAFDASGWDVVGAYSAYERLRLDLAELLDPGEYVTSIALCYGAVAPGFASTAPLSYLVAATHPLDEGTVIPNSAACTVSRNRTDVVRGEGGAVVLDEPAGVLDRSSCETATEVSSAIDPRDPSDAPGDGPHVWRYDPETGRYVADGSAPASLPGGSGRLAPAIPVTGDLPFAAVCAALALLAVAAMTLVIAAHRRRTRG